MINSRALTLDDIKIHFKEGDEYMDYFVEDDTNQNLVDQGYIIGTIKIDSIVYTIIHGFPGDNPQGIIFNDSITCRVGECIDANGAIGEWYHKVTDGLSEFSDPFWYLNIINAILYEMY